MRKLFQSVPATCLWVALQSVPFTLPAGATTVFQFSGRGDNSSCSNAPAMNWSGSTTKFKVSAESTAASPKVTLRFTPVHDYGTGTRSLFRIGIDGQVREDLNPTVSPGEISSTNSSYVWLNTPQNGDGSFQSSALTIPLPGPGTHTLEVTQISQGANTAALQLSAPETTSGVHLLSITPQERTRVVFYGDSITAGYLDKNSNAKDAVDGPDRLTKENGLGADISISYAYKTVQNLKQAPYSVAVNPSFIAYAGIGLRYDPWHPGKTMFNYYDKTVFSGNTRTPVAVGTQERDAAAVVINLGTNDIMGCPGGATIQQCANEYKTALQKFIQNVRVLHPQAKIILDLWGMTNPDSGLFSPYYDAQAQAAGVSDRLSCFTPANGSGTVARQHPGLPWAQKSVSCFVDYSPPQDCIPETRQSDSVCNYPGSSWSLVTMNPHPTAAFAKEHAARLAKFIAFELQQNTPTQTLAFACPDNPANGSYLLKADRSGPISSGYEALLYRITPEDEAAITCTPPGDGLQVRSCILLNNKNSYPKALCERSGSYYQAAGYIQNCTATASGFAGQHCTLNAWST